MSNFLSKITKLRVRDYWNGEYSICPKCSKLCTPAYHNGDCIKEEKEHMHSRCGGCHYEWTLPPRDSDEWDKRNKYEA